MGKNGGGPTDTILTLEEALRRFKRKKSEVGAESNQSGARSNVRHADFSAGAKGESEAATAGDLKHADESASSIAHSDDADAGISASSDVVAVIDGIPRTLEQLEQLAAAEAAYEADFAVAAAPVAEAEEADDGAGGEIELDEVAVIANRHALVRDYAFTAMGTSLMVLVAVLMGRAPTMSINHHPTLVAQSIPTPALKASSLMDVADDLISTLVIVPDVDEAVPHKVKSGQLEAKIKDTLKLRAFPDIGVSVSKKGDAYLAGEVYSMNEARKIKAIVHSVNGVNQVHFLHPDVRQAQGPAFFGVTTASAPAVWGAKVQAVLIGSPADKAGIKAGDVISEFGGNTIPDGKALDELIAQYSPGQRVQFRVWHEGQPEYLVARMGEVQTVASR